LLYPGPLGTPDQFNRCHFQERTGFAHAPGKFEMRVIQADGTEVVETFSDARDLAKRQDEVQRAVSQDGWDGPHGWLM